MNFLKKFGLAIFGMLVGCFFFFPWNDVRDQIATLVQKQSGIQIQMQRFSPTLGLRMGLAKGSLFAFSTGKTTVRLPNGISVSCNELIIGPRFWPVLMAQLQLAVSCSSEDSGQFVALVKASPLWGVTSISAGVDLDNFSLENVDLQSNLQGILSGNVDAADIMLDGSGGIPSVTWKLSGKKVRTPSITNPVAPLPDLDLDDLETFGSVDSRSLKVETLKFGSANTLIQGDLKLTSAMTPDFIPTDGELSGNMRIDPVAEAGSLSRALSWKTVFGDGDEKGYREFKRPFNGTINVLMTTKYMP